MIKAVFRDGLKYLGWAIIFYLFIFQPIVSKFYYLGLELLLFFLLYVIKPGVFRENRKIFRKEYVFIGFICTYSFLLDLANFEVVYLDRFLACFFQGYLVSLLLIYCISKYSFLQKHLSSCIILTCFIACSITISAILIPGVGQFCMNYATQDSRERLLDMADLGMVQYRSFGLSESLNFTYAYVLSIIGGYLLSQKFKLYTPFLLIMIFVSIIFNARTAFIPLGVAILYIIFLNKKDFKSVATSFITIFILAILGTWGGNAFPELNNEWGLSFFSEISDIFSGKSDGTVDTLTGSMWIIPENAIDLIFGKGISLFEAREHSDVGYILQLNYGGLIILTMIITYLLFISKRILLKVGIRHWFTILFVSSIFILNFKGFYLAAIPGNRFLTFLYVYFIYASRKGIKSLDPGCPLI